MKTLTSENRREFIGQASKIVYEWNVHLEIFSRPQVSILDPKIVDFLFSPKNSLAWGVKCENFNVRKS